MLYYILSLWDISPRRKVFLKHSEIKLFCQNFIIGKINHTLRNDFTKIKILFFLSCNFTNMSLTVIT